jgi:aldehyde dehydrogenase (NAD+)
MSVQHVTNTGPRIGSPVVGWGRDSIDRTRREARRAPSNLPKLVADLRDAFRSGRTRTVHWRLRQLAGLERMITDHEALLVDALREDMGKPVLEAYACEIGPLRAELALAQEKLPRWARPERVHTPLVAQPGSSRIVREPLGLVLIIAPWNYPFRFALTPLIGAIAAGNCVVLKPSETSPAVSRLLFSLLPQYIDSTCVKVVEGGVPECTQLLAERFDHIFFTGSSSVARVVMTAAAQHLTPVTLELGGKCPCIVDCEVDLLVAARRICWGKFLNAGQTCAGPDYVLVHERIEERLIERLVATVRDFYGGDPQASPSYARIVNERHYHRLMQLLPGSGEIVVGGEADLQDRYVAPTILRNVPASAPVMAEEIFGPILPVLKVRSIEDAIEFVESRAKPLGLYVFSSNEEVQRRVIENTSSGGSCINQVAMQVAVPELPFGGVGSSGMGAYQGRHSFETFSHRKGVLNKPTRLDSPILYPPYTDFKTKWLKRLL